MSDHKDYCPNHHACKIIVDAGFPLEQEERTHYIHHFCQNGEAAWSRCKRYMVKEAWHLCPDFVLPDTRLSPDEILDIFEKKMMN